MGGTIYYQIAIIDAAERGSTAQLQSLISEAFLSRGLDPVQCLRFFLEEESAEMKGDSPQITVFFGGLLFKGTFNGMVATMMAHGNGVIPVVPSFTEFQQQVPDVLWPVNGMAIPPGGDLAPLVSLVMESLRLLRSRRRLFLSYKRTEALNAATQIYHELDAHSFDPFLDTHSIRSGDPFQERLWHRMADCDLVVLLYTAGVLTSGWVGQELGRASAMGISVLQVIWPDVDRLETTYLFEPFHLMAGDFLTNSPSRGDPLLSTEALGRLTNRIEGFRARAIAAREARLLKLLCGLAAEQNIPYVIRRIGCVDFCTNSPEFTRVCLGLGVPDGPDYHETVAPPPNPLPGRTFLMYDPLCIAPFHQEYLNWLSPALPVGTLTPATAEQWLRNLRCT
jgi:hypothetical protein